PSFVVFLSVVLAVVPGSIRLGLRALAWRRRRRGYGYRFDILPSPVIPPIQTARLVLVAMTPDFLRASLAGDHETAEKQIGLSVPRAWPDVAEILLLRLWQLDADPALQHWLLRAIGLRSTGEMVGHIGFHEAPGAKYLEEWCPGGIELGFTVFPV